MSTTQHVAVDKKTAWSGVVLWPHWTMQILATLASIVGWCWTIHDYQADFNYYETDKSFGLITSIVLLILSLSVLPIVAFEITRYRKRNLPSKTMLKTQIILSTYATVCFAVEIVGVGEVWWGPYGNIASFFGVIIATAFFYGTLIYTSIIYHRRKKARAEAVKSFGMASFDQESGANKHNTHVEIDTLA